MRKRKYLIGATLALAVSVVVAAVAQATVDKQTLIVSSSTPKQEKKTKGGAEINVTVDTSETPPTSATQTAAETDVDFDKDFTFNAGKLPTCNPTSLAGTDTATANTLCGASKVGSGAATLCSALGGCAATPGGGIQGTVTAFNGVPSGGNLSIILHARFGPPANATTVLNGTLVQSPLGAPYGKRLVVSVPDTALTGLHLTHFQTEIPKMVTVKGKKKKGKKGKKGKKIPPKYYVSANCSDKTWDFKSTTTFRAGAPTQVAQTSVPCTQKKTKKKKKKK
jgi:hypothetical protein